MAKKANPTPSRTCADCSHFSACHLWAVSISTNVAPQCPQFEPARYASIADLHEMHQMAKGELVPVVRCRECKYHRNVVGCPMRSLHVAPYGYRIQDNTVDDGFCHMGAKMDGGAE